MICLEDYAAQAASHIRRVWSVLHGIYLHVVRCPWLINSLYWLAALHGMSLR